MLKKVVIEVFTIVQELGLSINTAKFFTEKLHNRNGLKADFTIEYTLQYCSMNLVFISVYVDSCHPQQSANRDQCKYFPMHIFYPCSGKNGLNACV
jgi:hypothetical protein